MIIEKKTVSMFATLILFIVAILLGVGYGYSLATKKLEDKVKITSMRNDKEIKDITLSLVHADSLHKKVIARLDSLKQELLTNRNMINYNKRLIIENQIISGSRR
jgi:hypothetical protein